MVPNKKKEELKAEKFVDQLFEEGAKIECNNIKFSDKYEPPSYYDEQLYKKGQEFFHKYIFGMFFAKFNGLIAILAVPQILKILSFTQKSSTNFTAYVRYVSTVFHMLIWYEDDFVPGSKLWKSLALVNKKHSLATESCCKAGLNYISQKDMAITQFGFMGLQICRSKKVGIYDASKDELEAFIHLWRVIGHAMGIEDRFNICSGTIEETKEICNLIIDKCLYPEISKKQPVYVKMSGHLVNGLWCMNPFLVFEVIMNYLYAMLQKPNTPCKESPYFKLNFLQSILYAFFNITFNILCRFKLARYIFNSLQYLDLWFMRNWPILAYYSFGNTPQAIVKLKI